MNQFLRLVTFGGSFQCGSYFAGAKTGTYVLGRFVCVGVYGERISVSYKRFYG